MTEVNIPIGSPTIKNIDGTMLDDSTYYLINGYLDGEGNVNSRPGIDLAARLNTSAQIDGAYWWDDIERVMMVSGGHLWVINSGFSGTDLGTATNLIGIGTRATFATDGTTLFIANGTRILQSDGSSSANTIYMADADAPTAVTHVIFIDGYLMANEVGTGKIHWANLNAPTTWSALDFATAEGSPDDIVAVHLFRKEIYLFGKISLEIWENDGQTPFSRVNGGYIDTGCIAPYSIVKTDNGVMWLDDKKRIVKFSGGGVEHVATPYDKEIQKFGTVSDCIADRIDIVGREFYRFTFPTENRTIVYNLTDNNWSEDGYWNSSGGFYERFIGNAYCFSPLWNQHIWGTCKPDGAIYKMSPDYLDDDGNPMRTQRVTGHISYGTNNMKRCDNLSFRAKRGSIGDSSTPVMTLRLNDDGQGFNNEIQISLGAMGDYFNNIKLPRMGMYRTRQYEFTVSDAVSVAFGHGREDIYNMGR